ncbi:hypothetical protein IMSAGC020_01315 [Lachnospiraceae bacterium]|nr:hypothetical protein IMSAGC020_01315 [Lachnospiraceae bacterium]
MQDVDGRQSIYLDIFDTGIHHEKVDDFDKSYYKYVYRQAFRQLSDIIAHNRKANDRYHYNRSGFVNSYEKFSNIMTFIGKRGSGKTSVMMSFMEALKGYSGDHSFFIDDQEGVLFTCLDCIDGSLLEHGEDIFKIVLAQMYQKFRDLENKERIIKQDNFDYGKRELLKGLEEIYKTVCDIDSMDSQWVTSGESYMSSLQSLSSSQKVKREFEKLVKQFTNLIEYGSPDRHGMNGQHYVVITIDDIDLNVRNGFSMLEKIHRYFMVSNVIILLSVDMEQILSIVFQNFYDVVPKVDKVLRKEEERIRKLSMDYLDKVMLPNYRIYLPELNELYSANVVSTRKEQAGIKSAVLGKLYRRIGICFDSQGRKRHFYEPKSMRNLMSFYLFLDSIKPVDLEKIYFEYANDDGKVSIDEKRKLVQRWESNCQLLLADLSNRLAFEKIYSIKNAYRLFNSVVREDIHRASGLIMDFYNNVLKKAEKREGISNTEDNLRSYGELIELMYYLGRVDHSTYKPLIHCLLAYFSYTFTREYIFERLEIRDDDGKTLVRKGSFKQLMGNNLINQWAADMLPDLQLYKHHSNAERGTFGIGENDKESKIQAYFNGVMLTEVFDIELKGKEFFSSKEDLYRYMAELINSIEVMTLFFNIRKSQESKSILEDFCWEFHTERNKTNKNHLKIKADWRLSYVGDFNVLNFVINSMYACENLKGTEERLKKLLEQEYLVCEDTETNRSQIDEFELLFQEVSLMKRYERWEDKCGKAALPLPVYWFDFSYNINKRVRREMLLDNPVFMEAKETFVYIQKLYRCFENHLARQDEFYGFDNDGSSEKNYKGQYLYRLKDKFTECPVVQFFLEEAYVEERKEFIAQLMNRMRIYTQEI